MHPKNFLDRVKQPTKLSFWVAIACVFSPKLALADAPHYQVELATSLPECNRKADLLSILEPLLVEPTLEPAAQRTLTMRITKKQALYRVDLIVTELDGREIDSTYTEFPVAIGCFETLYRGALRAAVRMNQDVPPPADAAAPAAPACPPQPPAAPPCPACEQPAPEPPKPAPMERNWFFGAGGSVGFGIAPDTAWGMHIIGGWERSPSWSFEGTLRSTFPVDARLSIGPTIVRVYSVVSGSFAPCYRLGALGACGVVAGGGMWSEAPGLPNPQFAFTPFLGVGGRGFLEQRLSERWSIRADLDVIVSLLRAQIQDDVSRGRWTMTPITGSVNAELLVWF